MEDGKPNSVSSKYRWLEYNSAAIYFPIMSTKGREIDASFFDDQTLVLTFLVIDVGVEHLAHYQVIILRNRVARVRRCFAEHGRHKN